MIPYPQIEPLYSLPYKRPEVTYTVKLFPNQTRPLQVWKGNKLLDSYLRPSYRPWKLQIADVDGDGLPEIAIGVVRKTKFTPIEHKCIFIMRFDGKKLQKKWMGSSMGRPVVDFAFSRDVHSKRDLLTTLETTLDGQLAGSKWSWHSFGFKKALSAGPWAKNESPRLIDSEIKVLSKEGWVKVVWTKSK